MRANRIWTAHVSALAIGMLLAGCGGGSGGGVNSTPAPSPTPTPSPSPSSSPTPTPGPANTSLLNKTGDENFTNDSVTGTAAVSASSVTGSAALSTVTVAYNQASGTYTIYNGTRSQSFAPSDRDNALSSLTLTTLKRTSGTVTDTLVLTVPTQFRGRGYEWVGGGVWQRTTGTSGGSVDAFAYGVETVASDVPRTGSAVYDITLMGVGAWQNALTSLAGTGSLNLNFRLGHGARGRRHNSDQCCQR
jgi:hypothetical protein